MPGPSSATVTSTNRIVGTHSPQTVTADSGGENLSALCSRFTRTWPSRSSSPRTYGRSRRDIRLEADPLAVGEGPQPLDRAFDHLADAHVRKVQLGGAAFDAREVEQLVDHLDQVAGLDIDLDGCGRASAAARRLPAAPDPALSVSVSSRIVVSGVRSSCDRLSMNSERMRCSRRSSVTSSTRSHMMPSWISRNRSSSRRSSSPPDVVTDLDRG